MSIIARMSEKTIFDIFGAAKYVGTDRQSITNWMRKGLLPPDGGRRIYLPSLFVHGAFQIDKTDIDLFLERMEYKLEEKENKEAIEQSSKKGVTMSQDETLDAAEVIEYIEEVMEENKLRPGQKIDTLLQAIEDETEEEEEEE